MVTVHSALPIMAENEDDAKRASEVFIRLSQGVHQGYSAIIKGNTKEDEVLEFLMKVFCFCWNEAYRYGKSGVISDDVARFMRETPGDEPRPGELQ